MDKTSSTPPFILIEKRKELYEKLMKQFEGIKHIDRVLFVTLNCVDDQDKEFIRLLKAQYCKTLPRTMGCFCGGCKNCNWIDKITGDLK